MTDETLKTQEIDTSDGVKANLRGLYEADARSRRPKAFIAWIVAALVVASVLWFVPFVPALYFKTITVTRLDAKGKPIDVEVGPGTKQWISIEKVSRHMVNAVIVAEDGKFYSHHGFDFEAIQKAIEVNRKKGRYVRGASTISQQVIKMAFLTREKTMIRKIREATGTILMEILLPKDKIIEWYINLCEFGGGIYGVKPAGMYYFKTRPELLTIEQAVNLAVVIPSPNKWSKGLRARNLTPFGHRRYKRIVNALFTGGYITEVQKGTALVRGNFGNPIMGTGGDDDLDDCRGDRECEDGSVDTKPDQTRETPKSDAHHSDPGKPEASKPEASMPEEPRTETPGQREKESPVVPAEQGVDNQQLPESAL